MELSCMVNTSTMRTHEIWFMVSIPVIKTHDQTNFSKKRCIFDSLSSREVNTGVQDRNIVV